MDQTEVDKFSKQVEIELRIHDAVRYFEDGWSITMSMSKAGFTANWTAMPNITNNPLIIRIRALGEERLREKRMHKIHV